MAKSLPILPLNVIVALLLAATAALVLGGLFTVALVATSAFKSSSGNTFTVTSKESVSKGGSHKYLVYTDVTTYEVDDTWLYWRFDSSDVYGKLKIGGTYTCTLQGRRIPFLSMFQNIIDPVEAVETRLP